MEDYDIICFELLSNNFCMKEKFHILNRYCEMRASQHFSFFEKVFSGLAYSQKNRVIDLLINTLISEDESPFKEMPIFSYGELSVMLLRLNIDQPKLFVNSTNKLERFFNDLYTYELWLSCPDYPHEEEWRRSWHCGEIVFKILVLIGSNNLKKLMIYY